MSCTVIAVPYALAWVIGAVATAVAAEVGVATAAAAEGNIENQNKNLEYFVKNNSDFFNNDSNCEDIQTITADHFIEKDFETPFVDREILVKTLKEHGAINIDENDYKVFGTVDSYNLTFTRTEKDKPFSLRITTKEQNNTEEKVNDLNSEYALNVQEDAYLHVVEKLKENNMQIEEEVVEDDNTIILTVNIE